MTTARVAVNREGFSLVEVLVALTLLGVAMLGLGGAATLGLSQMAKARQDLQYSADVQQVTDSLVSRGFNKVASGASVVRGRPVSWSVTNINPKSQMVSVVFQRRGQANTSMIYADTVTLYLAPEQVQ